MKIHHKDLKNGIVKLETENLTDLWYLSQLVDSTDLVSGKTFRKFKLGGEEQKVVRKPVFMQIEVEKVSFSSNLLRLTGKIRQGPDDVPLGSYHSFNIEESTRITLQKAKWLGFQLEKLKEAQKPAQRNILLVALERDEVHFAILERFGYTYLNFIKGEVQKKDYSSKTEDFYANVRKALEEYDKRYSLKHIVLGSPSFWKEDLLSRISDENLRAKIVLATCSSVGRRSFDELLKREEVQNVLKEEMVAREIAYVERLMEEISKQGLVAYGIDEVHKAGERGSIERLLVTDTLIGKLREQENYSRLENIFKLVEQARGKIVIISHEHEAGQKLQGIGGIGAILRFRME